MYISWVYVHVPVGICTICILYIYWGTGFCEIHTDQHTIAAQLPVFITFDKSVLQNWASLSNEMCNISDWGTDF